MNKNSKEKLKVACEESDKRARIIKVAKILEGVKYPTENDRLEAVLGFARSSMTESEIEFAMAPANQTT